MLVKGNKEFSAAKEVASSLGVFMDATDDDILCLGSVLVSFWLSIFPRFRVELSQCDGDGARK